MRGVAQLVRRLPVTQEVRVRVPSPPLMRFRYVKITNKEAGSKYSAIPFYASEQAAGMDLSTLAAPIMIGAGCVKLVPTGIAIALQKAMAQIRTRSGLAAKHYVTVLNSPGTIDADYRGEIK